MVRITKFSRTALKLALVSAVLGAAIPMYADAVLDGTALTGGTARYDNSVNVVEPPISQTLNWTCDTCGSYGFSASGSARVVNGTLGATSTVSVPSGSTVVAPKSESTAQFDDTLTITGGSGSGYLDLTFVLDGSMSNTGTGINYSQAGLGVLHVLNSYTSVNGGALSNGNLAIFQENLAPALTNTVDFYLQFNYGTQFTITPDLYTVAQYYKSNDTAPYTATADFFSTAAITSVHVYSAQYISHLGSPITTANIASTDGFEYGPNGLTVGGGLTTVPEPGTWLPVLLGLGLLGFAKGKFLRRKGTRKSA